jgi:hypothetical protein
MLPDYLIIGAARCGTTYIAQVLRSHPEVFMARQKELHFFERDYDKGMAFYESNFPPEDTGQYKVIGEATPAYLYFPEVPERIHRHLPDAKLIVSLRNPIDAAYSAYWKAYSADERTRRMTFEQKLEKEPRLIAGGRYAEQLARYLALFPRERIHVIVYEQLVARPEAEFRRLFRFLGVAEDFVSPYMTQRINASGMKNGRSRLLRYAHRLFFRYIEIPSIAGWIERINFLPIPPMAPATRQRLQQEFAGPNAELESLTGADLSAWAGDGRSPARPVIYR